MTTIQKINCKKCMDGLHDECLDPEICLCAENNHDKPKITELEQAATKAVHDIPIQSLRGLPENISVIEALGNKYIEEIVCVNGLVTSSTSLYNLPSYVIFSCSNGHQIKGKHSFSSCPECGDKKLEDETPRGAFQQHRTLYLISDSDFGHHNDELRIDVNGDLCNLVDSGDRVKVTGIIETEQHKKTKNYHNIVRCEKLQKIDDVDLRISPDDEEVFKEYPHESDFYTRMINSIAPSIQGYTNVKESILLQLIGSPDRLRTDGTMNRGWIHIGLFGDAGTAKTKFGEWIVEGFPRCQMVMSKGATSTGLIMGLEDGPDGRKVLKAGALVRCRDGGIVILDEFPRLTSDVIDGLYTTAESGMAAIAKTGHQAKAKADSCILATGNAYNSQWNEALNIQDNLGIDGVFLQRFDLMWIFIDDFNKKRDDKIANAILNDIDYDDEEKPFSNLTLSKYIKFVRKFRPELTKEVSEFLKDTWLELRANESAKENGISPRHLNTLIRTTLSISRLYQREYSTIEDATKAINLITEMFKQRNISISEADTYIQRNLNKALSILKEESFEGTNVDDLFDKVLTFGTDEDQEKAKSDLSTLRSWRDNKKWREVVEVLKRSPLIDIKQRKPLILAYDKTKGDLRNW